MLVGYPPFFSDDPSSTCQKILKHKKYFAFPAEPHVSEMAKDLIKKLVCEKSERIGFSDIIKHPWMKGVDWDNIR